MIAKFNFYLFLIARAEEDIQDIFKSGQTKYKPGAFITKLKTSGKTRF